MMSIYPIVSIELSFVQFSLLCYEFCILSKIDYKSFYYHFTCDHESSRFRKLARNKWICRENCDFFFRNGALVFNNGPRTLPGNPLYCIILDNWISDNLISVYELFAKTLWRFAICRLVNNNLWVKSVS